MTSSNPTSITDIEEQIAKITAELEKAREIEYTAAEKVFQAAQKRTDAAQTKVNELNAKASTTAAAQSRLALAKAALTEQESLLADATTVFNAVKAEQEAADEFAKNVALVLSGKKLGKKIKLNKKEKAVVKEDKKIAKKIAKQEKKAAKKQAKDDKKNHAKLDQVTVAAAPTTAPAEPEKPTVVAKKVVAKKPPVKKAAPLKKADIPAAPAAKEDAATIEAAPETPNDLPLATANETPAVETGKDVIVERETLPVSENSATENVEQPIND